MKTPLVGIMLYSDNTFEVVQLLEERVAPEWVRAALDEVAHRLETTVPDAVVLVDAEDARSAHEGHSAVGPSPRDPS